MKNGNLSVLFEKIQYILLLLYVVLMYILGGSDEFRIPYIPLLFFIVIEMIVIIKTKTIKISRYLLILFLFIIICLCTCLWAQDKNLAITRVVTLLLLVFSSALIFNYCKRTKKNVGDILMILLISGVCLTLYMICYYGVSGLITKLGTELSRVGGEINNVNTIGMELAMTALIAIYFGMNNNKKFYLLAALPIILALSTASKKAIIGIVLGLIVLIVFKKRGSFSVLDTIKRIVLPIVVIIIMAFMIQTNIFPTLTRRLETFSSSLTGEGKTDLSTEERNSFIEYGFASFLENPIGGVGVGNSGQITMEAVGRSTYLHNNYIELLATTGLFGTIIYYYVFVSMLFFAIKNRKVEYASAIIMIFILCLTLDWGMVSYYNKITYIYILAGILFYSNTLDKSMVYNLEDGENIK